MAAGIVLEKMLMLVLLMLIGFGCAKAGWIDSAFSQKASRLVMNVFLPATILNAALGGAGSMTRGELAVAAAAVFVMFFLGGGLGWLAARILPFQGRDRSIAWLSVFFMNNMFIGFPVVQALFGDRAVFCASLSNLPFNLLLYTVGVASLRAGEGRGKLRFREILTPPLLATLAAVVIFLTGLTLPALAADTLSALGAVTVPMSMVVVGVSLSHVPMKQALLDGRSWGVSLVRLLLCPLAAWLVLGLFLPGDSLTLGVLVIISACPSAAMITILSVRFGADDALASKINFLSTILCAVTLPVITWLLL